MRKKGDVQQGGYIHSRTIPTDYPHNTQTHRLTHMGWPLDLRAADSKIIHNSKHIH